MILKKKSCMRINEVEKWTKLFLLSIFIVCILMMIRQFSDIRTLVELWGGRVDEVELVNEHFVSVSYNSKSKFCVLRWGSGTSIVGDLVDMLNWWKPANIHKICWDCDRKNIFFWNVFSDAYANDIKIPFVWE